MKTESQLHKHQQSFNIPKCLKFIVKFIDNNFVDHLPDNLFRMERLKGLSKVKCFGELVASRLRKTTGLKPPRESECCSNSVEVVFAATELAIFASHVQTRSS